MSVLLCWLSTWWKLQIRVAYERYPAKWQPYPAPAKHCRECKRYSSSLSWGFVLLTNLNNSWTSHLNHLAVLPVPMVTLIGPMCTRLYFPSPRQWFPSTIARKKCPSPTKWASDRPWPFPDLAPAPESGLVTEDYETRQHYTNGEVCM